MKRSLFPALRAIAFALTGALSILVPCHLEAAENLKVEKIGATAYAVLPKEGGKAFANSAFIVLDDGVFVVDTQPSDELALELISLIKETTNKPIKYLLLSHYHGDHTQGIGAFPENVVTFAHEKTIARLEAEKMKVRYPVIAPSTGLSLFSGSSRVQILWMGRAHTDGDLVLYLPADKIIITGDIFFNQIVPYTKDANIGDWLLAVQRIQEFDFEKVVPGHGPVGDRTELRRFQEMLAWARAVVDREMKKGTAKEKMLDAAKEMDLYKDRIANYAHQERLSDLFDRVYAEVAKSRSRFNLQQ